MWQDAIIIVKFKSVILPALHPQDIFKLKVVQDGVDSGQKDEQGGLWDQRLTSCQTQGAVKETYIFYVFRLAASLSPD